MTEITVCIGAHASDDSLERSLRSVRGQRHASLDILVVDDGGRAEASSTARRHASKDPRVRYFAHQLSRGTIGVIITALLNSRAPYLAYLRAGDILLPDFASTLRGALVGRPKGIVAFGSSEVRSASGELSSPYRYRADLTLGSTQEIPDDVFDSKLVYPEVWGKLYPRALLLDALGELRRAAAESKRSDEGTIGFSAVILPFVDGLVGVDAPLHRQVLGGEGEIASVSPPPPARPEDPAAVLKTARSLSDEGNHAEAKRWTRALLSRWPRSRPGLRLSAHLAEVAGTREEAFARWSRYVELFPEQVGSRRRLGKYAMWLGHEGLAERSFVAARVEEPERFACHADWAGLPGYFGRWSESEERWKEVVELLDSEESWTRWIDVLARQGRWRECERELERARRRWPESVSLGLLWAGIPRTRQLWQEATRRWEELVERFEDEPKVITGYASILCAQGHRAKARRVLSRLPGDGRARLLGLAEVEEFSGSFRQAVSRVARLLDDSPRDVGLWSRYGMLLSRDGRYEDAARIFGELLSRLGFDKRVCRLRATALIRAGDRAAALEAIASFPAAFADDLAVAELLAWRDVQRGQHEAAKERIREVHSSHYIAALHAPIEELELLEGRGIDNSRVRLFMFVRDEMGRIPEVLGHYRGLGVGRFYIIDNGSTDGTLDYLREQGDVTLYRTSDVYSAARSGIRWLNELLERHAGDAWCIYADADELLVYPEWEERGLEQLVDYLDERGFDAVSGFMIDMYAEHHPGLAERSTRHGLREAYPLFDENYEFHDSLHAPYFVTYGGPRFRLFADQILGRFNQTKTPIFKPSAGIRLLSSSHEVTPARVADVSAAMLHYKLDDRFLGRVARGETHFDKASGALESRLLVAHDGFGDGIPSSGPRARRYTDSRDLVNRGLLRPGGFARWTAPSIPGCDSEA